MRSNIVGFTGVSHSGKDTAATVLIKKGWVRYGFADAVKDFCAEHLKLSRAFFYEIDLKDAPFPQPFPITKNVLSTMITALGGNNTHLSTLESVKTFNTPREILQYVGTDIGRNLIGENVWIDYFQKMDKPEKMVVTDVRFPNEVNVIQQLGGIVIRLTRKAAKHKSAKLHESESLIDSLEVDHEIQNTTTKEYLHNMVLNILDNENML